MTEEVQFMQRCLELASGSLGNVAPNPMVGAVLVSDGKIIGEGFHGKYGEAHAEVNAINSFLKFPGNKSDDLRKATLYLNLEPCTHFGKTPPCTDLIVKHKIPKIVIGCTDPNEIVNGKGINSLKKAGCNVLTGVLEKESLELNRRFITYQTKKRPFIILKFAKSSDSFIAPENFKNKEEAWLTNTWSRKLVHKWRSEEQAVVVGTNTALADNPLLTIRFWHGNNPIRIVVDRTLRLPKSLNIFNSEARTIIFNEIKSETENNLNYIKIDFHNALDEILNVLYNEKIQSLIVEGGAKLLSSFIENNLWDEARVFTSNKLFVGGIKAPVIPIQFVVEENMEDDKLKIFRNIF
ncbi:MAG: bifunctional diaminohydroxyphosphoribosylaminopyrimidine deaminase/5-amino-6-(5-phosphoribosylamino)uracil reductase RibD [Bacteroidia bacterium]|nr:bifunctional diaminohydroxyphosphoribosylaminopyrimidine deaminase/5-amino-6-(5-phosphoribosylamino)uracil reductase RibD [Bacteroidia bacterium]